MADTQGFLLNTLSNHLLSLLLPYWLENLLSPNFQNNRVAPRHRQRFPKGLCFSPKQGKACHNKKSFPLVFPFFPAWNTDKMPGGSNSQHVILETSWQMKATVLRMVTQRDSRSQRAAAAQLAIWISREMRKIRP